MSVLERLAKVIAERRTADPGKSWTAKLLSEGRERCARKFGEESIEAMLAGAAGRREELVGEAADAMFHLLVLLESNGVVISEVFDELERREGRSGIDEKASRILSADSSIRIATQPTRRVQVPQKLTERMQRLVRSHPAGMVATVNEDGTPAVSPKGTFVVLSSESLAFGNIRSPGTIRNLRRIPDIEACFLDVLNRVAVRVSGTATIKRRTDCSSDLLLKFEAVWPEYVSIMEDIVTITVGSAQLIRSPAYDIGYSAAELRKANFERLRRLPENADGSDDGD